MKKKKILEIGLLVAAWVVMIAVSYIITNDYMKYEGTVHYDVNQNTAEVSFGFQAGIPEKLYVKKDLITYAIIKKDLITYAKEHDGEKVLCTIKRTKGLSAYGYKVIDIEPCIETENQ